MSVTRGETRLATSGREEHRKCPGLAGPDPESGSRAIDPRSRYKPGVCPVYPMTSHIHERICEIMVWFSAVVRHSGVRAAAKAKRMHDVRRQ
jgi:hypothetical protein